MIMVDIYMPAIDESFDFMLDENADLDVEKGFDEEKGKGKSSDGGDDRPDDVKKADVVFSAEMIGLCGFGAFFAAE